jgi:hypothetical protein
MDQAGITVSVATDTEQLQTITNNLILVPEGVIVMSESE